MQAGDPTAFAFRLVLLPNPHGEDDRATPEERESWGAFAIWANGENLCAHIEQGEILDAAHWYMLPLIEWLVDNWDPLLHEERLPLTNTGLSAAESLSQTRMPPLSLKEVDEFEWMDVWSAWWKRHCLRSGREGGLFPDLYIRRYRDKLELSTGAEAVQGIPDEYVFLTPNRSYHVEPTAIAETLFGVLDAALRELQRRVPRSQRLKQLRSRLADLMSPERETRRMAWLAGLGDETERYSEIARAVDNVLEDASPEVREQVTGTRRVTPLLVEGSAYARLLYGAISPATGLHDVIWLTRLVVENYVPDASRWLSQLDLPLEVGDVRQLSPGEQGSRLGEKACELLGGDGGGWVDVDWVVKNLDIAVSEIELSDDAVRAVSIFGPTQRPHIFSNSRTWWGQSSGVRRFTLTHELCHLLFDREYGDELAIATGPWAPVAIEQRANAFAAAFLMPTWLLRAALATATAPADAPDTIRSVSAQLHVSASSLIDRLYNLGEITFDDRIRLRSVWLPERDPGGRQGGNGASRED
jgi:Zn-dependent peptidase ImmA (M78 family)